ncbi:N-terminal phage integrase SAM-like domain-containing protein [Streptomyces sp. NBC_00243]|nr:phage integrase SAM-like domain-containing protein [Streptomyces sp. NBC_00243]WRZ22864.1 N-terminal phage integrase SAM-like domain-containing protein [Streptomyces sp. NBC_00243]
MLNLYILPTFRTVPLREITTPQVRRWRTDLLDAGVGPATVSKAYQVLRAIMNTAVDNGLIQRNPCRIKGAGSVTHTERPVLSVAEVYRLADAAPPH